MKQFLFSSCMLLLMACGNSEQTQTTTEAAPLEREDPRVQKGLELVASNDCFGCHKIAEPMTGPAYQAIADRYRDSTGVADQLAERIIKGSVGHWGPIQMTPHPALSKEDAKLMVDYILSLKQ